MRVVICLQDFCEKNLPLQPWLTFYQLARFLSRRGHEVTIVTDTDCRLPHDAIQVSRVSSLRKNGADEICHILRTIEPEWVFVTITPLNLATSDWFGYGSSRWLAYTSYAFYNMGEIARARRWLKLQEWAQYARHLLVPAVVWKRKLYSRFAVVVAQSQRTAIRLSSGDTGGCRITAISAGIDTNIWRLHRVVQAKTPECFLYVGSAKAIRGFDVLLDAMQKLKGSGVKLRILARAADRRQMNGLIEKVRQRGLRQDVDVIGGWLPAEELANQVRLAKAVVLPFVLVPSELPVSVIESVAVGTPVIVSDVDGLPEAAGGAGMVVRAGDAAGLADTMLRMHEDATLMSRLKTAAINQASKIPEWPAVSAQWEQAMAEHANG